MSIPNIQEAFLTTALKEKRAITIYLLGGVKITGNIQSFDKYSLIVETNTQRQLIFKHAISTVFFATSERQRDVRRQPAETMPERIPVGSVAAINGSRSSNGVASMSGVASMNGVSSVNGAASVNAVDTMELALAAEGAGR